MDYTPRLHSTIGMADAPYYSPVDAPAYGDARKHFDGLVQIAVLYAYDKETGGLKRIKGGGGFTWGCDNAQRLCGWSWWAATTADNVCGNDWLMVHEFGHQLDSLFEQSGHPEFWFNHIALREGNIARYSEHFDANAYIRCSGDAYYRVCNSGVWGANQVNPRSSGLTCDASDGPTSGYLAPETCVNGSGWNVPGCVSCSPYKATTAGCYATP